MRKFLLFIYFLFLIKYSTAQNSGRVIDSLQRVLLNTKEDTTKVNGLNILSQKLWLTSEYDKAMSCAKEALALSEKLKYQKGKAKSYNSLGAIYREQSNYAEALKNNLASLEIEEAINDRVGAAYSYRNIGNIYMQEGNYSEALKNQFTSLKIEESLNDKPGIASSYGNIGNIYNQQGNYMEALKEFQLCLKMVEEIGDKHSIEACYNNIGIVYVRQGDLAAALKNYQVALQIAEQIGDKLGIARSYNNIGNIYFNQGNTTEALKNNLAALKIKEEIGDKNGIAYADINLGYLYTRIKKYAEAEKYLLQALDVSREIGGKDLVKESYAKLSELDSATGNFKDAYRYHVLYSNMKDSIFNERSNKQISQLKIQYETEKKDQQIHTQDLQLQNETLQNKILETRIYYGIIFCFVIGVLIYLRNKRKKKEYIGKVVELELKVLKSQLKPHFIFNTLISIKSYIDANPQAGTDYLGRFSMLMRGILKNSEEKEISLGEEMQLMEHYLELEKLCMSNKLDYTITYGPLLHKDSVMVPPLITQPVIENAIRHGLTPAGKNREIYIHNAIVENTLIITIRNNALKDEEENITLPKRKSFGLKITRERLLHLKQTSGKEGNLSLEVLPNETEVRINIPLMEK